MKNIFKLLDISGLQIKSIDEATRTIWHPITREVADRYGDIVRIDGADVSEFQRKPAVLYGHDYRSMNPLPVIGENVGFKKEGDILYAGTKFLSVDTPGMSQDLKDLINDNWLLQVKGLIGWSIGFMEIETSQIIENGKFKGYDFKQWKLLEYSSVIIPAHQDAVNNAIKEGKVTEAVRKYFANESNGTVEVQLAQAAGESAVIPESVAEAQAPAVVEIKSKKSKGENMLKSIMEKLATGKALEQAEIDYLALLEAKQADPVIAKAAAPAPVRALELVDSGPVTVRSMAQIINLPSRLLNNEEKELQRFNDDTVIVSTLLRKDPRTLKMWAGRFSGSSALRKALDTATASEGTEWVPTLLSSDFITAARLEAKVAALIPDYPMPSNPWVKPYFGGIDSDDFYLAGESISDSPTASPAATPDTSSQTFTAKKLKARILFSDELDEDSIIAVLPTLRADIVKAIARVVEDVIINGDTTATHQDSNVTDSKDRRKAWSGLRKLCPAGNKADLSTFSTANILAQIVAMGKYGVNPNDLAFIAGAKSFNKFRGNSDVMTVDKYGPNALIHNGELAKFLGSPIIVSEYIAQNQNATGVYDGTTTTYTSYLIFNKLGFALGSRGGVKVTFKNEAEVDQNQLILSFRKAFSPLWTPSSTITTIAIGYKIS
jgi:HK97 family phage major capsid protein